MDSVKKTHSNVVMLIEKGFHFLKGGDSRRIIQSQMGDKAEDSERIQFKEGE